MTSKPKPRGPQIHQTGIYKPESIRVRRRLKCVMSNIHLLCQDVAESLGITGLSDAIVSALASDIEYRLHQVVEVGLFERYVVYWLENLDWCRKHLGSCDMASAQ